MNLATVEGQTALAGIDENNAFIKENVSSYEQQKILVITKPNPRAFKVLIYSMVVLVVL
jgi:hypothetical protein